MTESLNSLRSGTSAGGSRLVEDLNEQQVEAVTHGEGPQLVLAGAGSGKTRIITYRIAWLVREVGIDPRNIAAVTFTNKAAGEMTERVEGLLGFDSIGSFVGTFHRFSLRLLRRYGDRVGLAPDFVIFDAKDQMNMVKKALELEELAEGSFRPRAVLSRISAAKSQLLDTATFEARAEDFYSRRVARVYRRYQGLLRKASAVDFDDMLFWAVRLLRDHEDLGRQWRERIDYLLVDEFQDTNTVQLELVKTLAGEDGNLTAVGDEDQGIYRWRGAELDNILRFESHFPRSTVRKLERNYRSTQTILDAAGAVVAHNVGRRGKRLWTEAGKGDPIALFKARDEGDEARWIARFIDQQRGEHELDEMAILVRTHAQTRAIEEELIRQRIPYALVAGVRFYDRAEIKDLVAYLRVLRNPRDTYSLERIINQPPRGIGSGTMGLLDESARALGVPLWDALLQDQVLDDFPTRGRRALETFRDLVLGLQDRAENLTLPELIGFLIEETDYLSLFGDDAEGQSRRENIEEFLSAAQELSETGEGQAPLDELTAFLDHVSLATSLDTAGEVDGAVTLMTLHGAKGLEFPVVVIGGLEDGILPHFNAKEAVDDVEEERRLLYVGMTRAKERLALTCCRRRRIAGRYQPQEESPFLAEIPSSHLDVEESASAVVDDRSRGVYSFFGRPEPPSAAAGSAAAASGSSSSEGGAIRRNANVLHPTLGQGVVMDVTGSGGDARITVYFDRYGKRKLVAKYAKLEVVG